jgi:xanthine dehydrogenase iron-sulfur cluster and FAD-binding subunit A
MTSSEPAIAGDLHEVQRPSTPIERIIRPGTWADALAALRDHPDARPVSGGTDLLLDLARSPGSPVTLVDLSAIAGARDITETGDELILAGGVTHNQVIADPRFRADALPLAQACLEIGSPQLRNRATVAGNLATASPANDSISALMALDATVVLSRLVDASATTRDVAVGEFFTGFRTTVRHPDELITAIRIPRLRGDQRGIWVKLGLRRAQAISVVHAAMVLDFTPGRDDDAAMIVSGARLAVGSVAATVIMVPAFADALIGRPLDADRIAAAADAVAVSIAPIDDVRATASYRIATTRTIIGRALRVLADDVADTRWPADPPVLGTRRPSIVPPRSEIDDTDMIEVTLNGSPASGPGAAGNTLLDWLRDHSSDACSGVKEGCAEGECGACTVQLDGAAVMSCLVPAAQADGAEILTVEGLADPDGKLHPLQGAFIDEFAVQCGFCIPGFLVAGAALLDECPAPTDAQISLGLSGNLCRCTGYYPIAQAIRTASDGRS